MAHNTSIAIIGMTNLLINLINRH